MSKQRKPYYGLIANKSYGLYVGYVQSFDTKDGVVIATQCRQVCQWYGKTGGITSLAEYGLCGPRAAESRIGAAMSGTSTLSGVVNVFECSKEAQATFEAAKQS